MKRTWLTTLALLAALLGSLGCDSGPTPTGGPRTAGDGTTFQDMSNGTTTITHPNGSTSIGHK